VRGFTRGFQSDGHIHSPWSVNELTVVVGDGDDDDERSSGRLANGDASSYEAVKRH
jgi:hypothetical protein